MTDGNILNLPLIMRHSFEYILLLSLVNSKTLKDRGGLEWSMCGVDENGKESVTDSLAAEFRKCEFTFQLPDDDDPLGTLIPFRVQLYATDSAAWAASQSATNMLLLPKRHFSISSNLRLAPNLSPRVGRFGNRSRSFCPQCMR